MAQAEAVRSQRASGWSRRWQHGDGLFWLITLFFALVVIGLVVAIGIVTYAGSAEARSQFGFSFLFQDIWQPIDTPTTPASFGALPAVYGTLMSSLVALLLAGPIGVGIGIFLAELCPQQLKTPLSFLVELLAAIPSVIYGLWGVYVFAPFFVDYLATPIANTIGQAIPLFAGPVVVGRGILLVGIILAIMILPTVASITRDVIAVVPNTQREVMLAMGATRWQMIAWSVLPYARAGIIGAIMLGLGRALGETIAAALLSGNTNEISTSLFQPGTTAASLIANELPNANGLLHESALITIALILFGITLLLNLLARLLVWQVSRGPAGSVRA